MNWEELGTYLMENLPLIITQVATMTAVLVGKPKTAEQIKAKKEKALQKKTAKNLKLRKKLEQSYSEEAQMAKELGGIK